MLPVNRAKRRTRIARALACAAALACHTTAAGAEPAAVYQAGESFYEAPNSVHQVSANASDRKPARLLAYFICDRDTPLSAAVADPASARDGRP